MGAKTPLSLIVRIYHDRLTSGSSRDLLPRYLLLEMLGSLNVECGVLVNESPMVSWGVVAASMAFLDSRLFGSFDFLTPVPQDSASRRECCD